MSNHSDFHVLRAVVFVEDEAAKGRINSLLTPLGGAVSVQVNGALLAQILHFSEHKGTAVLVLDCRDGTANGGLLTPARRVTRVDESERSSIPRSAIGAPPPTNPHGNDGSAVALETSGDLADLTQAEFRVANLVAKGWTNRQTADHLFLSPHTVDTHLRHVFSKLGISSRVELARQFAVKR